MPYRSEAQRRKFHELLAQGKISPEIVMKWDKESEGLELPERVEKAVKKAAQEAAMRAYLGPPKPPAAPAAQAAPTTDLAEQTAATQAMSHPDLRMPRGATMPATR